MKYTTLKATLLAAALLAAQSTAQAGWLKRYVYMDMPGTAVTNLLNGTNTLGEVIFPNLPSETELIPLNNQDGTWLMESMSAKADNFGSYIPGYIEPPETGDYVFWVCGDDEVQLWLTTDAADSLNPAKKQKIASVPVTGWSNAKDYSKYPEQQSAPINLEKGKRYYFEILHKDGTGGDNVGLAWKLPSGKMERPMRTFYFQPKHDPADSSVVNGPFVGLVAPKTPGELTVYDGMEVVLFADLNLAPPYTVAWLKGGAEISGATQTYYSFRARNSDNGAQFSIRVNGTVYGPITLTVAPDSAKPELVSATIPGNNPTQISLVFSEEITPASANSLANYTLNSATIQSAQLQPDGFTVLLKTSLLSPSQFNTLGVSGIQDWASPANTITALQTNLLVVDAALNFRIWYATPATSLAALRTWSATNSTTASYVNDLFDEERIIATNTYPWNLVPLRNNYGGQMIGYLTAPETGNYKFGIASDDNSILYLGTSEDRATKREICSRDGSGGQWNFGLATSQRSAYIPLEAGKRYYFEAVFRDGTGGDGMTIGWEKPSDTTAGRLFPTANESVYANVQWAMIPTNYLSRYATVGNVFFKTNLPATFTAAESTRPVLKVTVDGTPAYAYQWYRNDAAITGANAASYTLPFVRPSDNNATFYVVVTNNFSAATSVVSTLTVTGDSAKPSVASVGSLYKQTVEVRLSEPVTASSATALGNYSLFSSAGTAIALVAAVQDTNDASHITLQTAALPETDLVKLVVRNLVDLSAGANMMDSQTNTFRANNFDSLVRINNSQAFGASANGDQITITAGGSDIWGTADQLAYLYKSVTGNFDYKVQGVAVPAVNGWTKAGPMARVSIDANSRNGIACFTPATPAQNQYSPQVRDVAAGNSTSSADAGQPLNLGLQMGIAQRPTVSYPSWLRLQRVGDTLYYWYSPNGTNWTFWTKYEAAMSAGGPLPATMLIGLGVTSHDTARTADVVMASFTAVDDGALRFTLSPTNITVAEGATATFTSVVAGRGPWTFEWTKNGAPMNSTSNTLSMTMVPFTDNDSTIQLAVSNPYGERITASAKLLVLEPDKTKPTVAKVGSLMKNTVEVYFSEGVTTTSAGTIANYTLRRANGTAVTVTQATPDWENPAHVTLTTADMPTSDMMELTCQGLVDLSIAANVMTAQMTPFRAFNFEALENINNTQAYSARAEGDQIFMTAGGADIWGTADQCAFLYRPVSGNFDVKVQGVSLPLVNAWTKMGIMVRTSPNSGGDRNVFTCFTPVGGQNTYSPQARTNTASASISVGTGEDLLVNLQAGVTARPTVVYPSWLRLQRIGDKFYYYYSTTGTNWTFWTWYDSATSSEGPLPNDLYLGLALTSHDAAQTVNGQVASFANVEDGPMRFLTEPVSITVGEGANASFTASVVGRGPYFYQWLKNDVVVANATGGALNLTNVAFSDNGSRFICRVTNPYGDTITSSNAILTVVQDVAAPVVAAVGSLRGTSIGVYFQDGNKLDLVSAGNPQNYTVNNGAVAVTAATVEPDGLAVMLTLGTPVSGEFSVTVKDIKDGSPLGNKLGTATVQGTVVTWPLNGDVGTPNTDPLMPGFAQAIGTEGFYLHAGGSDIWNAADGMHFLYQAINGNFDVAVRVTDVRMSDVWAKAGLMVRADLDASSRNYVIATTPTGGQNLITMQWRLDKNAATGSLPDNMRPRPSMLPNAWLRVSRQDQVFSFYYATNGVDWVNLYTTNEVATPYPGSVFVGVAATAHNNGGTLANTTGAYFRNLTGLTGSVTPQPAITASLQGSNLVLTWITTDGAFKLQSSAAVETGWQNDPATAIVAGDKYTVTVPVTGTSKFYRLIK